MLQSGLEFISNAARAHTRTASSPPPPPSKPTKTVLKKQQTQVSAHEIVMCAYVIVYILKSILGGTLA